MQTILLTIAYDGTKYAGWQVQENAESIQGIMMKAGKSFLPAGFTVTTASRTDAGVHALGQRALLKTESAIPARRIAESFNHFLPADIRVWKSEAVSEKFHPRYHATNKEYCYRVLCSRIDFPFLERNHFCTRIPCRLDKMRKIASLFVGKHDFNGFSSQKKTITDTVREIRRCEVREVDIGVEKEVARCYEISVEGNGFLYHMVRILAGCIIEWSTEEKNMEEIEQRIQMCFETGDRSLAAHTMPAKGLTLIRIDYENEIES